MTRAAEDGDAVRQDAPAVEVVIDDSVAAAIAARAAATVAGVIRLEPGLSGLASHLAARARQQVRRGDLDAPAATEGVQVTVEGTSVAVAVDLATDAAAQAAAVAQAVQAAVADALLVDAGLTATRVTVSILDIERPATARQAADP